VAHKPFITLLSSSRQVLQEGVESSRRQLLIEAFVSAGRVDNITMVMGLHPQYLSSFWKTQYLLLRMDGPLPYHKRHYIAIMVRVGVAGGGGGPSPEVGQRLRPHRWGPPWSWGPRGLEVKPPWAWPRGAHPGYPSIPPLKDPGDQH